MEAQSPDTDTAPRLPGGQVQRAHPDLPVLSLDVQDLSVELEATQVAVRCAELASVQDDLEDH